MFVPYYTHTTHIISHFEWPNSQEDPNHNMCSRKNNKPSATCAAADGPVSVDSCPGWFAALWAEQKEWVSRLLPKSQATWQIAVTHFPCGHEQGGGPSCETLTWPYRWCKSETANYLMQICCNVVGMLNFWLLEEHIWFQAFTRAWPIWAWTYWSPGTDMTKSCGSQMTMPRTTWALPASWLVEEVALPLKPPQILIILRRGDKNSVVLVLAI